MAHVRASLLRSAIPAVSAAVRSCSTTSHITADVNNSGIAKVFMNKRPANAVDTEFFKELKQTFDKLENDHVAGVILSSTVPKIFSAGLDISKMAQLKPDEIQVFAESYYDCWQTLYEFPLPTAAAITGHAPALGCLLSTLCEHRVMVEGCGNIGLNEVAFGLPPDRLLVANFRRILSHRVAESAVLSGKLFTPVEAFQIGLIDELAKDRDEALSKCEEFIKTFTKIPAAARGRTKKEFRQDAMKNLSCPSREEFISIMNSSSEVIHRVFQEYSKKFKNKVK